MMVAAGLSKNFKTIGTDMEINAFATENMESPLTTEIQSTSLAA
jgi:hypothetical protein